MEKSERLSGSALSRRLSIGSWVLYDFSDTIFSASILTFYFPLWVTEDMGGSDALLAVALSLSMLVVAIAGPGLGAVSDRLNRRVPLLGLSVGLCALCVALIGWFGGLGGGIVLFGMANFMYQTGLIFYNSLILNVSTDMNRGLISGIGAGAGYIGLIAAFLALAPFVDARGNEAAFIPTALLYVVFAAPLLLLVRESGVRRSVSAALIRDAYSQLYATFRDVRRHGNLFRFLLTRLMYMEGINTVTSFFVIYLVEVGDFTEGEARDMIIRVVVITIFSSLLMGLLVSLFGAKRVMTVALIGWAAVVLAAVFATEQWMFWAIALVMGVFWSAPQIADRVLLAELAPRGQIGEFFGLFQMSGRLSAVMGPALWGLTTWGLSSLDDVRYRVAVLIVAIFVLAGLVMLQWVREERGEELGVRS